MLAWRLAAPGCLHAGTELEVFPGAAILQTGRAPGIEIRRGSCVRPVVLLRQREAARPRGLVASRKSQLKEAEGFELEGSLERASVDRCVGQRQDDDAAGDRPPMVPCTAAVIAADAMRFTNPTQ